MKSLPVREKLSRRLGPSAPVSTCRRTRQWVGEALSRRLGPEAGWVRHHLMTCPRCRKRLAAVRKVETALDLIRSQPHSPDLLSRANTSTIRMLTHDLREAPKARELEQTRPAPVFFERFREYHRSAMNVAACLAIALLARAGVFNSLDKASTQGQQAVRQYYASHTGEDLASEIFDS
jgi:anti-sigma factor RsiW